MAKVDWKLSDKVGPEDMNQIGSEINQLRTDVDNIEIPEGSTTQKGIVQSSNSTTGSSQTLVATEKAVGDALVQAKAYVDQENLWGAL
ncbi:phage tail protein [Paenibacillus illinoisensis]|uniref:Phage tail protein n=1 Tax=Paenibacillus illinoisensis TaxID=59845 RepID=A0ABW8HYH3_9BACL